MQIILVFLIHALAINTCMYCREGIEQITEMIAPDITSDSQNPLATTPLLKVLCALRFYASGSIQRVLGDTVGLSDTVISCGSRNDDFDVRNQRMVVAGLGADRLMVLMGEVDRP